MASTTNSDLQFDNLADRLGRLSLQEKSTEGELEKIMVMTLEELQEEKNAFGKTHVGKTFHEMTMETKYLTWFTETYRHSRKPEHVKLLRYVQLYLAMAETEPPAASTTQVTLKPKAKAKMPPAKSTMPIDLESEVGEDFESWDPIHEENHLMTLRLQDRMNQMEGVMQEVLAHLRRADESNPQ